MISQRIAPTARRRLVLQHERRAASLTPDLFARIASHLRAGSLERELIAGADPLASPALAARAATLCSRRTRTELAAGLERSLAAARGPQRRWWAVSPHSPLLASADEVRELAELLRGEAPLRAAGVAMLKRLLTDGGGPAYRGRPHAAARPLREARAAMLV
jgi:hypothetical protein